MNREAITKENPGANFETVGKLLGTRWSTMTNCDKVKFQDLSNRDRVRYDDELVLFKDRTATAGVVEATIH